MAGRWVVALTPKGTRQTRTQVSTVSRAITLIGFDAVKSMAISSLIVDSLLKRNDRPHMLRCLARAIHATVQARCLMLKRTEHALEEVFIGALLMNIGETPAAIRDQLKVNA